MVIWSKFFEEVDFEKNHTDIFLVQNMNRPKGPKVGKVPAKKYICHASGIYQEIPENTGKYLQYWKI